MIRGRYGFIFRGPAGCLLPGGLTPCAGTEFPAGKFARQPDAGSRHPRGMALKINRISLEFIVRPRKKWFEPISKERGATEA